MKTISYPRLYSEFENLLYSALFHDIGKFWQHTRDSRTREKIGKEYSWYISDLGRDWVSHEQWSAYFLKESLGLETAETTALRHHYPETYLEYIVAVADKLSASEREEETEPIGKKDVSKEPLEAILASIRLSEGQNEPSYKPLQFSASNPNPNRDKSKSVQAGDYNAYWDDFYRKVSSVASDNTEAWKKFHSLYQLLEDFTVSVPSAAYYSKSTISLFDHAKTTTAIASALYKNEYPPEEITLVHQALKGNASREVLQKESFVLLGADLSGIQDFVFDLTARGAAKGLRGRSFYVSAIAETIASYILRQEGLSPANLLFSGGGHFYLLLPQKAIDRLSEYRKYINEVLFKAHKGRLSVVLAAVPLSYDAFSPSAFGEKWLEAAAGLQREKNRKHLDLIKTDPEKILGPYWEGDNVCSICSGAVESQHDKCTFCQDFEDLGEDIARNSRYLVESFFEPAQGEPIKTLSDLFRAFGYSFYLTNELPQKGSADRLVSVMNEQDFVALKVDKRAWLANTTPLTPAGGIKTFEEIAGSSEGIKSWGVLRGDVDNLGQIFSEGLGKERTISAVTSLSREISFFFNTQINRICANYPGQVYVIYAGGDDFFVVGSWSILPALAQQINNAFKEYTADNTDITLSCAVGFSPVVVFPLYKVAVKTGNDLDNIAKTKRVLSGKEHNKDSLAFFGKAFTWSQIKEVEQLKNLIKESVALGASKALVQSIYKATKDFEKYKSGEYPLHRAWRLIYSLTRLAQRSRHASQKIKEIESTVITSQHLFMENSIYAARWAELELRSRGE